MADELNAENTLDFLHDEGYDRKFNPQNLDHSGMIFCGGRASESLDGLWHFSLDLFDSGLRQKWFLDRRHDESAEAVLRR